MPLAPEPAHLSAVSADGLPTRRPSSLEGIVISRISSPLGKTRRAKESPIAALPVKAHLKFAFAPASFHQAASKGKIDASKASLDNSRKTSPMTFRAEPAQLVDISLRRLLVPEPAHLKKEPHERIVLNPLTFCPAKAHALPRTSSLPYPANAHDLSRNASPPRPQTLVQQGVAQSLTFFNKVQGCLLQ